MRGMKIVMAALLLAATILAAPVHARNEGPKKGVHEADSGRSWVVQVLSWLGLPPVLGSIWEADSSYIDPNGQPKPNTGGAPGASASPDSSAYIDPNG